VSSGPASEGSLEPAYPARRAGVLGPVALVVLVGLATVVGGVLTGDVLVTLTPAVGALVVWAMIRSPLRWQVAILLFLCLALEVAGDASDIVHTPLLFPGMLLMDTSGAALKVKVAGGELLAFFLIGLALHRRMARSTIDGRGFVPMPSATRDVLLVYAVGFVYTVGMSYATGHGLPPWKARYLIHFVLFFALFHLSLRDLPDFRAMGRAVIAAAHVKAFLAMWVQYSAAPRLTGGELAFATNHGDSILFVMAIAIAVIPALEGTSRRAWRRALWTVPIPFWGVLLNHRRIAYAMLELGFVLVYLYSPWNRWKKRFTTVAIFGAPLLIAYLALGWNSNGGGIFAPVHKVRTMVDGSVDPSTYWRDVEAWNIASTLRDRSPLGVGLGRLPRLAAQHGAGDAALRGGARVRPAVDPELAHRVLRGALLPHGSDGGRARRRPHRHRLLQLLRHPLLGRHRGALLAAQARHGAHARPGRQAGHSHRGLAAARGRGARRERAGRGGARLARHDPRRRRRAGVVHPPGGGPLRVDALDGPALAPEQARVLVPAQEAPELEVVVARHPLHGAGEVPPQHGHRADDRRVPRHA